MLCFRVEGEPATQGSMAPRGRFVSHANLALAGWREAVTREGRRAFARLGNAEPWADCPVALRVTFLVRRPKTVTRRQPHKRPDLDKYVRAVGDALEGVVYEDDAQIVRLVAIKEYAPAAPGAVIECWRE